MEQKKSVFITPLTSTNQVGGNIILLEDKEYHIKIIIDFGINYAYFDAFSQEERRENRKKNKISLINSLVEKQLLPDPEKVGIKGLYPSDKIINFTDIDAVLISHAHKDHFMGISFLNREIPVYVGKITQKIIIALNKSEELMSDNELNNIQWHNFQTGDVIKFREKGDFCITPHHVDHSVPGAYGFIFYTSAGPIVYSGDFRNHGPVKWMIGDFINEIFGHEKYIKMLQSEQRHIPSFPSRIPLLIIEGTKIHKGMIESEDLIVNDLDILFKNNPFEYFLVKYEVTDWDRFRTFSEYSQIKNMKFVIDERDAYLYYLLNQDEKYETMRHPNVLRDKHILVLKWGGKASKNWQKEIRNTFFHANQQDRLIHLGDLGKLEGKYMIFIKSNRNLRRKVNPNKRGLFISASVDPYSEQTYNNTRSIGAKLLDLGIPSYRISASGHANSHDIINFIEKVHPCNVLPIHTEHSELFSSLFKHSDIKIIEGKKYESLEI